MIGIKKSAHYILLIIVLTITAVCIYLIQYALFHKPGETVYYLLQDLAFVPVQAIIVTLVLDKMINLVEKQNKLKKINVIISAFFSEAGTPILFAFAEQNENHHGFSELLSLSENTGRNPKIVKKSVDGLEYHIQVTPEKLEKLKGVLADKKSYLISLLENNNLMEHDTFTDMLWAVFHVADELQTRGNLGELTAADYAHLSTDILRAYKILILEWLNYIKYLKAEYPFLYTIAVRKNPFGDHEGSPK